MKTGLLLSQSSHKLLPNLVLASCFLSAGPMVQAQIQEQSIDENTNKTQEQTLKEMQERINFLEQTLDERLNAIADVIDNKETETRAKNNISIGGYGEMHYNNLDVNGEEDTRELDFHRMVLFFGHEFNSRARFFTEFEVEHIIAGDGSRGAVELEQAYVEIDLKSNLHLQTGAILMPIGIINETHEPTTFYGVERPIVETTVIPTTWWSGGVQLKHYLSNGIRYNVMISEGLKTDDPNSDLSADPFDLKAGKQKTSFADAFDLAVTAGITYVGIPGIELAAYTQYQPDLDQSAEESYADSASLLGGHVIYNYKNLTTRALYTRWDLTGDEAKAAGRDVQDGGYLEVSWKINDQWGIFVRESSWSLEADVQSRQTDLGFNYYPLADVVFKFDIQQQNADAGNIDGFNVGFGYQF